jgi:hypothetical protein
VTSGLADNDTNRLLSTAVDNVRRDYPVHWTHFVHSAAELVPQRDRHPVFAGSYDWHSCVHQTWLIVRLLRLRPDLPGAAAAKATLDELLTTEGCATEAAFFLGPNGAHWERPYGWAWLLLLDAELRTWASTDADADRWAKTLRPLSSALRERWLAWLPSTPWPIRAGIHANSAFATGLVLNASRAVGDEELVLACELAAKRWYQADSGYGGYEPDAADFLSPALTEADLMRRVFSQERFTEWFDEFLPDLAAPRWLSLREPVTVEDPADPYGSHLAGLALSRAWGWAAIAAALPAGHRYADLATEAAAAHRTSGRRYVFGHGYAAEHWLGTFASYLDLGALSPS